MLDTHINGTRILFIRNDKLGDFILSLPAIKMAKENIPNVHITVLVSEYTSEIPENLDFIDEVIVDAAPVSGIFANFHLLRSIKRSKFDAAITLFSTTRIGLILLLAGIPYRLAPATKLAQYFYNQKLLQRRSKSLKPESQYNQDLTIKLLHDLGIKQIKNPLPPYIRFPKNEIKRLKQSFCESHNVNSDSVLIFIHPGSGGSATNLTLDQYAQLSRSIISLPNQILVLSAGPGEEDHVLKLSSKLKSIPHIIYVSKQGLLQYAKNLAFADLFIAGSTGTLHLAGSLDIPTVAFYPRRRSATPLRWQTLNSQEQRLAFSPPETAEETDMSQINIDVAAKEIIRKFLKN